MVAADGVGAGSCDGRGLVDKNLGWKSLAALWVVALIEGQGKESGARSQGTGARSQGTGVREDRGPEALAR